MPSVGPASPPAPPPSTVRAAPSAPGSRPPTASKNRRVLVIGAIAVAILLLGGAVAVFVATALGFPDKYVLERSEMPSGMSNARLSAGDLRDAGMTENPGYIDWDESALADAFSRAGIDDPDEAHGQVLQAGGDQIAIVAMKYANEDAARAAATDLRAICSFGSVSGIEATVLRDGDVVVAVFSDDGASRAQVRAVSEALREKVDDLVQSCST